MVCSYFNKKKKVTFYSYVLKKIKSYILFHCGIRQITIFEASYCSGRLLSTMH